MPTIRSRLAIAATLGVLTAASLGAQGVTTGGIGGTVTDPSNNQQAVDFENEIRRLQSSQAPVRVHH